MALYASRESLYRETLNLTLCAWRSYGKYIKNNMLLLDISINKEYASKQLLQHQIFESNIRAVI